MDTLQFLALAEWLLKEHRHPAGIRSAISRAYYAAHHVAVQFVESAGVTVLKSNERHSDVVRHLEQAGEETIERIASELTDLRTARPVRYIGPKTQMEFAQLSGSFVFGSLAKHPAQ